MDEIVKFITQYIPLTDEEIEIIHQQNLIRTYKKDTILLSEGDYAKDCFFIMKGLVRCYYVVDGEEKTTEFYAESQPITPISYIKKEPSEYYLSCLEDCVIALGSPERNKKLMEAIPKLSTMLLEMSSDMLMQRQSTFDDFKKLNPEMRYLKFMETRKDLYNRVPLQHLATYLGVTPVSLSRMRKRISSKRIRQAS